MNHYFTMEHCMELSVKKEGNGQMKLRTIFWKNGSCGTEHKVSVVGTPPLPQQSVICFS
jgi:hypothetical protein